MVFKLSLYIQISCAHNHKPHNLHNRTTWKSFWNYSRRQLKLANCQLRDVNRHIAENYTKWNEKLVYIVFTKKIIKLRWYKMLCKCCANSRYKKTIVLKFNTIVSTLVGATGLEPATSWSQTRCATNCATPRLPESGCKITKKYAPLQIFLQLFTE